MRVPGYGVVGCVVGYFVGAAIACTGPDASNLCGMPGVFITSPAFCVGGWIVAFRRNRRDRDELWPLDTSLPALAILRVEMQLSFKKQDLRTLADLREGQQATLEHLDLPEDTARRLMELGFLPGHAIAAARSAPGGDPRVFRVDGSEVALRRETALHMHVRLSE